MLESKDGQYGLEFSHEKGNWEMPGHMVGGDGPVPGALVARRVICKVLKITGRNAKGWPETQTVAEGVAFCSPADNYDRETGRQVALYRALHKLDKTMWNTILPIYTHRTGAKRWKLDPSGHVKTPPGVTERALAQR